MTNAGFLLDIHSILQAVTEAANAQRKFPIVIARATPLWITMKCFMSTRFFKILKRLFTTQDYGFQIHKEEASAFFPFHKSHLPYLIHIVTKTLLTSESRLTERYFSENSCNWTDNKTVFHIYSVQYINKANIL